MSQFNSTKTFQEKPNKLKEPERLEPTYAPDWLALEQQAMIMLDYWQHIIELIRIEQILENIEEGGIA